MKQITWIAIIIICAFCHSTTAQPKPEKVYSIVKVQKKYEWYVEQYNAWEKELAKKKKDADGWLNYYVAARMAKIMSPSGTVREEWLEKMKTLIEAMKKAIPNTYEYHYILGYDESDHYKMIDNIKKAYEMNPERPETYDELLNYYEVVRDEAKATEIAKKWEQSGDLDANVLLWNYNMLASTAPNAIILTAGDMDTYPAWVLQYSRGFRKDVTVVNQSLIFLENYRDLIFEKLGIPPCEDTIKTGRELIDHIVKHHGNRPLYVGITANNRIQLDQDKLYNVGLALLYSEESEVEQLSLLINNYKNNLLLDHLIYSAVPVNFISNIYAFNYSYIAGLLMLHKHYTLMDNETEKRRLKKLLLGIVEGSEYADRIKEAIEQNQVISSQYCSEQ